MKEKLMMLVKDDSFLKEIAGAESIQEIRNILAAKEIELTDEQINQLLEAGKAAQSDCAELSDDDLENVAGGLSMDDVPKILKNIAEMIFNFALGRL